MLVCSASEMLDRTTDLGNCPAYVVRPEVGDPNYETMKEVEVGPSYETVKVRAASGHV